LGSFAQDFGAKCRYGQEQLGAIFEPEFEKGHAMNTNEFLQYLMQNAATKDLASNLASAYLQRAVVLTPAP
jgi:hypothetical protein